MKKAEKAKLHEDDQFIQFMHKVGGQFTGRQHVVRLFMLLIVGALVAVIAVIVLEGRARQARITAVDKATTPAALEQVVAKYPHDFLALRKAGLTLALAGGKDYLARSEQLLTSAVDVAPAGVDRAVTQVLLGKVKLQLEKYDEAVALFETAARTSDAVPLIGEEANWYAGLCYEKLHRPDKAQERFHDVITAVPLGGRSIWQVLAAYSQSQLQM